MSSCCELETRSSEPGAAYLRPTWQPAGSLPFAHQQQVLFYFMGRFTCSRCWHTLRAMARLQEKLQDQQTTVVVIGEGHHIQAAAHLAEELAIPFPLVADDNGTLRRLYGLPRPNHCGSAGVFVLVDQQGHICFYQNDGERSTVGQLAHILGLTVPHR